MELNEIDKRINDNKKSLENLVKKISKEIDSKEVIIEKLENSENIDFSEYLQAKDFLDELYKRHDKLLKILDIIENE